MCGIIGFINTKDANFKAKQALDSINYRGRDGNGFYMEKDIALAHCLHAIIKKVPQPIIRKDYVLGANCEIYNWKYLKKKHNIKANNDAELLAELLNKNPKDIKILKELDGVFSFFFYNKKEQYILLARDVLGVKPLWFSNEKGFVFASEAKAIQEYDPEELNPRKILLYNLKEKKLNFLDQDFFKLTNSSNISKKLLTNLLSKAIKKRLTNKKTGLLFSGGLDSTILAYLLKKEEVNFTAYMTSSNKKTEEVSNAIAIAKELNFDLKIINIDKETVKKELPQVTKLIESTDPVKTEVGLTMYLALKQAKKDKVKVIFSGVGADDIFAGYKRMRATDNINEDSLSNLRRLYERDLYRDDVLSMYNNIELRLPFLDKELVKETLNIPNKFKADDTPKKLLRDLAKNLGLPKDLTSLKRSAAQYSSGVNTIFKEIAKENNTSKSKYLLKLRNKNIKLGVLSSSGKDSIYAMHVMDRLNYDIACLISIQSENKDSFMFHTPNIKLATLHAKALDLPIIEQKTKGKKELELTDLKEAIIKAKEKYNIQGLVSGAIFSNYQRSRIEAIADELNLKVFSPLWHTDQLQYMKTLVKQDFEIIITKVAAEGLDESWLGRKIDEKAIQDLENINKKTQLNIAGEGGEFESLVLDAPMFKKKLIIEKSNKIPEDKNTAALEIKDISLKKKVLKEKKKVE